MSVLSTGTSALLAFQRAMATVSHNVANANTAGYTRQRVDLEARPGQLTGTGYTGQGVSVQALQRLADGLVFARNVDSQGELGRLQQLGQRLCAEAQPRQVDQPVHPAQPQRPRLRLVQRRRARQPDPRPDQPQQHGAPARMRRGGGIRLQNGGHGGPLFPLRSECTG